MPHFQETFAALSLQAPAHHESDSLSSRLKSLCEKGKMLQKRRHRDVKAVEPELVVISDDEADVASQRRRRRRRSPSTKSSSASSAGSLSDGEPYLFDALRDIPQPQGSRLDRNASSKRHKSGRRDLGGDLLGQDDHAHIKGPRYGARAKFQEDLKVQGSFPVHSKDRVKVEQSDKHTRSKTKSSSIRQQDVCPYYYDEKLHVRMYRGPGYERFPIVLGKDEEHQKICEAWDARQVAKHQAPSHGVSPTSPEDPLSESAYDLADVPVEPGTRTNAEFWCLKEVLNVFPQANYDFVMDKYRLKCAQLAQSSSDDVVQQVTAADVIAELAELETIPHQEEAPKTVVTAEQPTDETGVTIKFDKSVRESPAYLKEGVIILASEFGHVPTHYIHRRLDEVKSIFDTYIHLFDSEEHYYDSAYRPYNRNRAPRVALEKKYSRHANAARPEPEEYANLINEMQAAKQQLRRKKLKDIQQQEKEKDEAANLEQHRAQGALVTCQCCFDDEIPINRAATCEADDVHFFCYLCVENLAKSQVGSMKHLMVCMDGSGCQASLSTEGIGRAIPIKLLDKLAFYQQQNEIAAAGIEGLAQCPFCEFKAICEPVDVDSVFSCQNPDCARASCRKCNGVSHLPRTCEEVKKDHGLSARHQVEEARSEAMMRACPKCGVKIIKELGCNKMRCSCGTLMCYVCKKDISGGKENGYEHFHRAGSKCPLYDDKGGERHDADADAAEVAAIKEVKQKVGNEDIDEKTLRIEKEKKQAKNNGTAAVPLPYAWPQVDGHGLDHDLFPLRHDVLADQLRVLQDQAAAGMRRAELRRQNAPDVRAHDLEPRAQAGFDWMQPRAQVMRVQPNRAALPGPELLYRPGIAPLDPHDVEFRRQRDAFVDQWVNPERRHLIQIPPPPPPPPPPAPAPRDRVDYMAPLPDLDFDEVMRDDLDAVLYANPHQNHNAYPRLLDWEYIPLEQEMPGRRGRYDEF